MKAAEVLATFKKLGKRQTAAIYKHYVTGGSVFGVLTSEIAKLRKKIKVDDALARDLWKTENVEARALALQIRDPQKLTANDAELFVSTDQSRFLGPYLSDLLARSPIAGDVMRKWMKSPEESRREMEYAILANRLKYDPDAIGDAEAEKILGTIEKQIHKSPNWARYGMNTALISIGINRPKLRQKAIDTAARIGDIDVDHGQTHCKTPNAVAYIQKAAARKG